MERRTQAATYPARLDERAAQLSPARLRGDLTTDLITVPR
jgi:hypothetical protein